MTRSLRYGEQTERAREEGRRDYPDLSVTAKPVCDPLRGVRAAGAALAHLTPLASPPAGPGRGWRGSPGSADHALDVFTNSSKSANVSCKERAERLRSVGGDSPDIRVKVIAYRQSVGASDLLTWDKSTCIRTYTTISYCPETLSSLLTCLWNMAGAVEPLLYSRRKDIGVVTLCWRSLTWREVITVEISPHSTLTERNACIRSALMLAKAFPFTTTV